MRAAKEAGKELLLLKTTTFICEGGYTKSWAMDGPKYGVGDDKILDGCFECFASVRERNMDAGAIRDEDIAACCRDAPIIEHGSRILNERLYRFVNEVNEGRHGHDDGLGGQSRFKVAVFNNHEVQFCKTTTKG